MAHRPTRKVLEQRHDSALMQIFILADSPRYTPRRATNAIKRFMRIRKQLGYR